jgi:hypothetical protein
LPKFEVINMADAEEKAKAEKLAAAKKRVRVQVINCSNNLASS